MPSKKLIFRWLFALSLGVNAFLAVVVLAGPPHRPHGPPPSPEHIVERLTGKLSSADAAIFSQSFAPYLPRLHQDYDTLRAMPQRMRDILAAPIYDPQALAAAFADLHRIRQGFDDSMAGATVEAAGKMSPEGRVKLWYGPPP